MLKIVETFVRSGLRSEPRWGAHSGPDLLAGGEGVAVPSPRSLYVCMYVKSEDYGDVSAGAQQGRLTMS